MKQFINDLRNALKAKKLDPVNIDDIIRDYQDMMDAAIEDGLTEEEINKKFGDVDRIADELAAMEKDDEAPNTNEKSDTAATEKTYAVQDGYKLYIKVLDDDVVYEPSDDDTVKIHVSDEKLFGDYRIELKDNVLRLERPKTGTTTYFNKGKSLDITIQLPKNIALDTLHHETTNGDTTAGPIEAKTLEFISVNGDCVLSTLKSERLQLNTVNGDIKLTKGNFEELNSSMVSGDVVMQHVEVKNDIQLKSVSGDIVFENGVCNTLYFRTVSGDLQAKEIYPQEVYLKSVSGDIDIKNQKDTPIKFIKKATLSGDISIHK